MSPRRLFPILCALALLVGACGSTAPSASPVADLGWGIPATPPVLTPVLISNAIAKGKARIMFSYLDKSNRPAAAPDRTAKVAFYAIDRDPNKVVATADGAFLWTIKDDRGIYVLNVDLPEAGTWGAEFTTQAPGSPAETVRMTFSVRDAPSEIAVGAKAPASKTPTAADVGGDLSKVSTDAKPDPAFYETSVADALAAKKPFILVFATPKFCATAQCGPTLDTFKPVAAAHPEITFINVEPYKLSFANGGLEPLLDANNQLQATEVTNQWGLLSEPWIFAVDRNGIVQGSYGLTITDAELNAILPVISAGG